jgi:PAS domain S-box-containing protein
MLQLRPSIHKDQALPVAVRYGIAVVSVMAAYAVVLVLERLQLRDPYALIFLAAFWVSIWFGGGGPGKLGLVLSTLGLTTFLHSQNGWLHFAKYDYPVYCFFFSFAFLIYRFSRMRRSIETSLEQERDRLEVKVQERTAQLTQANQQYKAINKLYKKIFDALPFAVALFDPGRVVRVCNRAYEAMLGYNADELVGQMAPLPESEIDTWKTQEEKLRAGQGFMDYEAPRVRRDGSGFPARLSATPFFADDGSYTGLVGTIVDMTEHHALQLERQMLTALVQHNPGFVGVADLDGAAVFVNPFGQQLFGLEGDDHVKRINVLEFFAETERARGQSEIIPTLVSRGRLEFETLGRNFKTGKSFPLQCTGFVIPDAKTGAPAFIAAVAQDITERKKSEEELSRRDAYLTEGQSISHTGSWAWHLASKTGFWSSELFRILGHEPNTVPPTPFTFHDAVHPEDREAAEAAWLRAGTERTFIDQKHRIVRPDGSVRYVHSLGHPVESVAGGIEFIGTIIDVTQHHEDRIALEKALDENKTLQEQLRKENISIQESYQKLQDDVAATQEARYGNILGSSPALRRMIMLVDRVAPTETTVLITGETGTGKELIAQAIHQNSRRASRPFIAVNCAAITPTLITSELFGHEKGAFTGADRQHVGRFEQAEGGTIFLDEIGDVPLQTQLVLLRVLQERTFQRLGGNRSIPINVRVVAATNRELPAAMEEGAFRKDLFYRLNAFPIEVPPLRERREDIPILVHHFVEASANRHGKNIPNIEKRFIDLLLSDNWPGNIRQLQNVIDAAVIACDGDTLSVEPRLLSKELPPMELIGQSLLDTPLTESVLEYQRKRIEEALRQCNGQVGGRGGAATLLGMPTSTLQHRLKQLDINPHRFHTREGED